MSVNLSQNQEYIRQQNNFGASPISAEDVTPAQVDILKSMDLPSTPMEALKYSPYFIGACVGSKLISDAGVKGASLNPLKQGLENITVADSFSKSNISKIGGKIDGVLYPLTQRYSSQIASIKATVSRFTPNWVKNLAEKISIGVIPKNKLALDQYKGMTARAAESFINTLRTVAPEKLSSLGLSEIVNNFASHRLTATAAVTEIANKLKNVPAKDIAELVSKEGKKLKLLQELNTAQAFIGANAKTSVTKGLQRGIMAVSEAAGGGVIGSSVFGILMNSIFLASTIKRTWHAPWGEKLSTFMEGALVDFCGGYLMALLGTRLTYKILGIKNADKTARQLTNIKRMTKAINTNKIKHKELIHLLKTLKKGSPLSEEMTLKAISFGIKPDATVQEAIEFLTSKQLASANKINTAIDKLAKMKKLQDNGFFKNLINRPLRWIGNFFSTGLENLPAKVNDGKLLTSAGSILRKFTNGIKFCAGYPIRFLLVLMVVTPPLTKLCAKFSHSVFGKPTKSIMDEREGKTEENKNKTISQNPYHVGMDDFSQFTKASWMAKNLQAQNNKSEATQIQPKMSESFVNSAIKNQKARIEIDKKNISPTTYVPSTIPTVFVNPNIKDVVDKQSAKADKMEQYVMQELAAIKKC